MQQYSAGHYHGSGEASKDRCIAAEDGKRQVRDPDFFYPSLLTLLKGACGFPLPKRDKGKRRFPSPSFFPEPRLLETLVKLTLVKSQVALKGLETINQPYETVFGGGRQK